jgi:hypothetical protein
MRERNCKYISVLFIMGPLIFDSEIGSQEQGRISR